MRRAQCISGSLVLALAAAPGPAMADVTFTDAEVSGLVGTVYGAAEWADFDGDGDLDVVTLGQYEFFPSFPYHTVVYRNEGAGIFVDIGAGLVPAISGALAWGDADNDGDLDLLVVGYSATGPISRLYRNSSGTFSDMNAGLLGAGYGAAAWADHDADGDLDLAVSGSYTLQHDPATRLYSNTGGVFTDAGATLQGVDSGSLAWADYDADGDHDLLLAGHPRVGSGIFSSIYRNNGTGALTAIFTGITPRVCCGDADWGDYDNDGDPDLFLTGSPASGAPTSRIYRSDNFLSTPSINAAIDGVGYGSTDWGDYDNDGDLDLLLSGESSPASIARIYRNDGGVFTAIEAGLRGLRGTARWGDFDQDGDLDILVVGSYWSFLGGLGPTEAHVYRNDGAPVNTLPSAPSGLTSQLAAGRLTLSWNPASDAETPQPGLSYNVRIGTTPGGSEIVSAQSRADGHRYLVERGNVDQRTSWTWTVSGEGPWFWSVQAIDGAHAGSAFAAETVAGNTSGVPDGDRTAVLVLSGNDPNPFRLATTIRYQVPDNLPATIRIFDPAGRLVTSLSDPGGRSGERSVFWDGKNEHGRTEGAGVYYYRVISGGEQKSAAMLRLR